MTQKIIKIIINEIYSKPPKENYPTSETNVHQIGDIWSLDLLDLKNYGPENNRGYRYVLVVIDNFSKFVWTALLKKSSNNKRLFWKSFHKFKKKTKLIETDRGEEYYNKLFQNFSKNNDIKRYSRNSSFDAVYAKRYNLTIRDLPKKTVFERRDGNWVDVSPRVTQQYNY